MSILDGADLLSEGMALVARAEREGRDLTPDELTRYDAIVTQLQGRGRDSPPDGQTQQVEHKAAAAESAASAFSPGVTRKKEPTMAVSRYNELVDQRAALVRESADLVAMAHAAGRDLSDEELRAQAERKDRIDHATRQINSLDAVREAERLIGGSSSPTTAPATWTASPIDSVRPLAEDANWGYRFGVRMVKTAEGGVKYGNVPNAFDIALGDFLAAVQQAGTPGGTHDPRLFKAAASGGNTSIPSDGGFLVGVDFSRELMNMALYESQLAKLCKPFEIGANSDSLDAPYVQDTSRATGSRWGGVRVYRRAEADTVSASKPTLEKFSLELEDLMGIAYLTNRARQDAASLGQVYRDAFTSEFAYVIDDEIFRGSGVGQCLGFATSANGALVSVAAEGGQPADTIVAANVMKMYARMRPRSLNNAVWFINVAVTPQLQQMQVGTGVSGALVYMPAGGLSGSPYATLYGRPVIPIEQASALGDLGDITFADLSQYILIRKGGIEEAESMHVRFLYNEMAFRWVQRINGRPKDRSAVTPFKGSDTISPFVALAAR